MTETASALLKLSSTGGAGGILDIFYEEWKLKLNEHVNVVRWMQLLYSATYATCEGIYSSPFGKFSENKVFMYVDRVCFRLPDVISENCKVKKKNLQRSLTPHLDCCPSNMFNSTKEVPKWRPIQAFIALTDTVDPNEGGFEAAPGFHKRFDEWSHSRKNTVTKSGKILPPPCVGDFTPIRPLEDKDVLDSIQHIPCRAGDMVCWDYRLPHANSKFNNSNTSREAVYIGILPDIEINRKYAQKQLQMDLNGDVPVDQWHESFDKQFCDYKFSELGKIMMTIS